MAPLDFYDFTPRQLAALVGSWGFAPVHAARLWRYVYREATSNIAEMRELPTRLRDRLHADLRLELPAATAEAHSDDDQTCKYLLSLRDGRNVETVLMRSSARTTACLSSQVGCALGCVFCATGQVGFTRNLMIGEIVAQAMYIERKLDGKESLSNVVLMGMGEPLLNYDAVMRAIEILRDSGGLAIGAKHLTLSTVGVVPGIVRLADENRAFSLAVSLHAADQARREALVPAARTWPLDELMEACRYYVAKTRRRIFFEWTLIEGENDSIDQAHDLARLLHGIPARVNLIPLNHTHGFDGESGSHNALDNFRSTLREQGLPVSVRRHRGVDIAAGCGQLAGLDLVSWRSS